MSFFELLEKRASKSLLCIGLDPRSKTAKAAADECIAIIDMTKDYAAAYKPNAAFFELLGQDGWNALQSVIQHIPKDIPVILDAKRGDIADTAVAYAKSAFEHLNAHAITAAPYMGGDSLAPFLQYKDRGVFVLCKTSNKGSNDLQILRTQDGKMLFEVVAEKAATAWNTNKNVGLVVGATDPAAVALARKAAPGLWFLVPGVGTQGGDLAAALEAGLRADRSGMLINVSRGVAGAKDPRAAAANLCQEINAVRFHVPSTATIAAALVRSQCIRFGEFKLKSGKMSPIYLDLRQLVSHPDVLSLAAKAYANVIRQFSVDRLVGLPYAALPIATAVSLEMGIPMIYPRREAKEYGTKAAIEGFYQKGDRVVLIDDLVSTGETKIEAIEKMKQAGMEVVAIVVLIDREMGARKYFQERGVRLEAVVGLQQLLPLWLECKAINEEQFKTVKRFLSNL